MQKGPEPVSSGHWSTRLLALELVQMLIASFADHLYIRNGHVPVIGVAFLHATIAASLASSFMLCIFAFEIAPVAVTL